MAKTKMVYVSADTHRKLKLLAARGDRPMGELIEELVDEELAELANPWTGSEGLLLQQQVLAALWDDPDLDVYEHD